MKFPGKFKPHHKKVEQTTQKTNAGFEHKRIYEENYVVIEDKKANTIKFMCA